MKIYICSNVIRLTHIDICRKPVLCIIQGLRKCVLVALHHVWGALWLIKTLYIKSQFHRQKENIFSKFTTFQKVLQKQFGSLIVVDIKVLSAFLWAKVMHLGFTAPLMLAYFLFSTPSSVPKCSYNVSEMNYPSI